VLLEDALEAKAEALGSTARGRVEGVALPFQPPVAELVKGVRGKQVDRLAGRRAALQRTPKSDVADLDHAVLWRDA
jgi:hypothetical protein